MKKTLALLFTLLVTPVLAQNPPVHQSGHVTPGHVPMWTTNGVIQDGGTAVQGFLTSLGVTATGPGICQNSDLITRPYNQICLTASGTGGGFTFNNFGGATGSPTFSIGSNTYVFPFTPPATAVQGPISTTVGHIATWNNTIGTLLADTGAVSGNITFSGNVNYTGPSVNVYANPSTGNDSNDCLAATSGGGHGPCLTIAHAAATASGYDANAGNYNLHLSAGTFTQGLLWAGPVRGGSSSGAFTSGVLWIFGAGPGVTVVDDNTANCGTLIFTGGGTKFQLQDFTLQKSSGSCGSASNALYIQEGADGGFENITFGTTLGAHIFCEQLGNLEFADSGYTIAGSASTHISTSGGCHLGAGGGVVTCTGSPAFSSSFAAATTRGILTLGNTFSGCGSVTGTRFIIQTGGQIDASGNASATYLPGNAAGIVDSTSLYTPPFASALGTCTNGSLDGSSTDYEMKVNFSGNSSSCQINFGNQFSNNPACTASPGPGEAITSVSAINTAVTVAGTFVNGNAIYVFCRPLHW